MWLHSLYDFSDAVQREDGVFVTTDDLWNEYYLQKWLVFSIRNSFDDSVYLWWSHHAQFFKDWNTNPILLERKDEWKDIFKFYEME